MVRQSTSALIIRNAILLLNLLDYTEHRDVNIEGAFYSHKSVFLFVVYHYYVACARRPKLKKFDW
jgi:hypothetical protein